MFTELAMADVLPGRAGGDSPWAGRSSGSCHAPLGREHHQALQMTDSSALTPELSSRLGAVHPSHGTRLYLPVAGPDYGDG